MKRGALRPFRIFARASAVAVVSKKQSSGGLKSKAAAKHGNKKAPAAVETRAAESETTKARKKRPIKDPVKHADLEFRREFPEMFEGLCQKAKAGGTAQFRVLWEMAQKYDRSAKPNGEKSLSSLLLDELKRRQDEREMTTPTEADSKISLEREAGATSGREADVE